MYELKLLHNIYVWNSKCTWTCCCIDWCWLLSSLLTPVPCHFCVLSVLFLKF